MTDTTREIHPNFDGKNHLVKLDNGQYYITESLEFDEVRDTKVNEDGSLSCSLVFNIGRIYDLSN